MPERTLSDLQLAILRVLWDRGEATAAEVHADLVEQERELAPTTVATVLSRLEKKGSVAHRTQGRQYIYRAEASETEVRGSMVRRVADFFFGGDQAALLSHLVDAADVTDNHLDAIKELIAAKERESKAPTDG